ncbi:MAG: IS1380 family transposase [Actinomycetota bacterium]|nr:IS1380 family transposase [Actinomycetota bacterium]
MVHELADVPEGPARLDSVRVAFDEERLISDAGLMLTATLADRLGLEELVNESVSLDPSRPGACLPGRKVMSLVHGMLAGADSIDDMNVLRAGSTQLVLGHQVMAPSTLGTFLRAFSFGHVRQLDRVVDVMIARAWAAGAGPGEGMPLVVDIDSFVGEVHGYQKQGASYGYSKKLGYHPLLAVRADTGEVLHIRNRKGAANTQRGISRFIDELLARVRRAGHAGQVIIRADTGFENHKLMGELSKRGIFFSIGVKLSKTIRALIEQIPETAWQTVSDYPDGGQAQVAESDLKGFRLIVRRTRLTAKQADLFPNWRHHAFATNRTLPILVADTDHRDHATIELVIRDLIDQALRHFPSGRMHANSAWTVTCALAHNLERWVTQIGLPDRPVQTARARRRQLLQIPARLTRTSRTWTLRLPARWPWQTDFHTVLDTIRALPALT